MSKLKLAEFKHSDTVVERLSKSGFTVTENENGTFTVKSDKTGATLNTKASEKELETYLKCIEYVKTKHTEDIEVRFCYTAPVHN